MKVCGFTIVRNAVKYDYPVAESIRSILPICDEFVIAVGKSEDDTMGLIQSINSSKIKIMETVWDDNLREGGRVLADETNKAFDAISEEFDWAFYLQGDEVVHEKYLEGVKAAMIEHKNDDRVEGLLFNYQHFYGSYDYVGDTRKWYRREIRVIKNDKKIRSYQDAQGFRKEGRKLNVKKIEAFVYHYGWVKHPKYQQQKQENFHKMWHDDQWMEKNIEQVDEFDYTDIEVLANFVGTHPEVMKERIKRVNWSFSFDLTRKNISFKVKFLYWLEKKTGWRVGEYQNYRII